MTTLRESRFFELLLDRYASIPPIALCRVPELELLSRITLVPPVLDHCCGDGFIAATAFPGVTFDAGVDINRKQLSRAKDLSIYRDLQWADAAKRLPFPDASFATIFNNSAIEHIPDLDGTLRELARVLRPGGTAYLNVLNHRYFERWPLSAATRAQYRDFQPFYHALTREEWTTYFLRHGFQAPHVTEYFDDQASRTFAKLDYEYSAFYFRKQLSLSPIMVRLAPKPLLRSLWDRHYGDLHWDAAPGQGSGFLMAATKAA